MATEKPSSRCGSRVFLVTRRGFEPRTHCLKGADIATDTKSYTVF